MGKHTGIEWADCSTNPIMGCSGCELYNPNPTLNHCYAATLCNRYAGRPGWPASFTTPEHFPGRIEKALKWPDLTGTDRPDKPWLNGYPRLVFVNDLSDTFCPAAPDPETWLTPLLPAMAESPHIWLFLTKWARAQCAYFTKHEPPPNFWGLVSVTDQRTADARVPWLLRTPFAVRGVSAEPLLGVVNLRGIDYEDSCWDALLGELMWTESRDIGNELVGEPTEKLDLVFIGAESGSNARDCDLAWLRSLVQQAQAAGVKAFVKQLGTAWAKRTSLGGPDQTPYLLGDTKGGNWEWWPEDLRVREMP